MHILNVLLILPNLNIIFKHMFYIAQATAAKHHLEYNFMCLHILIEHHIRGIDQDEEGTRCPTDCSKSNRANAGSDNYYQLLVGLFYPAYAREVSRIFQISSGLIK